MHPLMVGAWLRVHQIFKAGRDLCGLDQRVGCAHRPANLVWGFLVAELPLRPRGRADTTNDTKWKGEENDKR